MSNYRTDKNIVPDGLDGGAKVTDFSVELTTNPDLPNNDTNTAIVTNTDYPRASNKIPYDTTEFTPKNSIQNRTHNRLNLLTDLTSTIGAGYSYQIGEPVKCRDLNRKWNTGIITSLSPLLVQQDGYMAGTHWDEVSPIHENRFAVGDIVWTKLEGIWVKGEIIYVRNSYPTYAFRSGVTRDYFNVFGTHGFCNNYVYFSWLDDTALFPDGASDVEEDMSLFLNDLLLATILQENENEWLQHLDAHSEEIAHMIGENEIQKLSSSNEGEENPEYKQQFHDEIIAGLLQEGELSYALYPDIYREGEEALYQEQNDAEISRQVGEREEEKKE